MIYFIKLKKYLIPLLLIFFTSSLIIFSASNLNAAKSGLILWANSVVPSLFPFFIATELLSKTEIPFLLGNFFNKFLKPIFNINGEGSFALIMGIISGYPIGAKIACNFRKQNILSKEECERLLSFTNNSSPMFILGTIGIGMYGSSTIGLLLLTTHILSCLTVGFLFRFWKITSNQKNNSSTKFSKNIFLKNTLRSSNLGEVLSNAISNAVSTITMIGGFVVLSSVTISIFKSSKLLNVLTFTFSPFLKLLNIPSTFVAPLITGFIEITNGISLISNIPIKAISINIILTSFLLGLGGLSIFLQVLSIVSKTDLSIKPYIIGKILHALISAFYTFLFMKYFPIFNLNL